MINNIKKFKYVLLVLAIFIFHMFFSYMVLSKSHLCRDYGLLDGIRSHRIIFADERKPHPDRPNLWQLEYRGEGHPPLVKIAQAGVIELLSSFTKQYNPESVILLTNGFFLFILLFSVYGIGSIVYSKNAGILAAFLVSFFPMVYGHSRIMMLDFPLASMVALSFCCLFKSRRFNSAIYSILSGIAIGLAVLTKESAVVFIAFPLIYYFYESHRFSPTRKTVLNFTLTLLFTVLTAGLVYLRPVNFPVFKQYVNMTFFIDSAATSESLIYLKSLLLYPGAYLFIALVPALIVYFRNIRWQNKTILLWFSVPLVVYNLAPNKSLRFIIPLLPAFALIVVGGISASILMPKIKRRYVYCIVFAAFLQYFIHFFNLSFPKPLFNSQYEQSDIAVLLAPRNDGYYPAVAELMDFFKKENEKLKFTAGRLTSGYKVLFLFKRVKLYSFLRLIIAAEGLPFTIACPEEEMELAFNLFDPQSVRPEYPVLKYDYIVDMSGEGRMKMGTDAQQKIAAILWESFDKHKSGFKLAEDMVLFNGSHLYIYKNINLER